jgi:hypothetical protein
MTVERRSQRTLTGVMAGVERAQPPAGRKSAARPRGGELVELPSVRLPAALADGACATAGDPDLWTDSQRVSEAREVCLTRCPVLDVCREWAAETRPRFGTWAGRWRNRVDRSA